MESRRLLTLLFLVALFSTSVLVVVTPYQYGYGDHALASPKSASGRTYRDPGTGPVGPSTMAQGGVERIYGLRTNIVRNPSFDEFVGHRPAGFAVGRSVYTLANTSYDGLVSNGSKSALLESRGSEDAPAAAYVYQFLSPAAYAKDNVTLDLDWYVKQVADMSEDMAYFYVDLRTKNGSNNYHYLRYYLLYGSQISLSNSSWVTSYGLNNTVSEWHHLSRNLTRDLVESPTLGYHNDSTRTIESITLYLYTGYSYPVIGQVVVDAIAIKDGVGQEYLIDGDFEYGSWFWVGSRSSDAFIRQTTDAVTAPAALNMTSKTAKDTMTAYAYVSRSLGTDKALRADAPGDTVISFDWKADLTSDSGGAAAYLRVSFTTGTNYYHVYWLLAHDRGDMSQYSNSSSTLYVADPNFGTLSSWVHTDVDAYDLATGLGLSNVSLYYISLRCFSGTNAGSRMQLLADNFEVQTFPAADPFFESAWRSTASAPVNMWSFSGHARAAHYTDVAHSGAHAANLTSWDGTTILDRETFMRVSPGHSTDFWWRLDSTVPGTAWHASIVLQFEGGFSVQYDLASAQYSPSNTSNSLFYRVDGFNTTGQWLNLRRNMTRDLEPLDPWFSDTQWNLTQISLRVYSDAADRGPVVLFDDIDFNDAGPPTLVSHVRTPWLPAYYEGASVTATVTDDAAGVESCTLRYRAGTGPWTEVPMHLSGGAYAASIPDYPYNTTVQYWIVAVDWCGSEGLLGNGSEPFTYVVQDPVPPVVSITSPADGTTVRENVTIAADAADEGSIVDHVTLLVDGEVVGNDSSTPWSIVWDSRTVSNGEHNITVAAHDVAGNMQWDSINLTTANDFEPPAFSQPVTVPGTPTMDDQIVVYIGVSDESDIAGVTLYYRFGNGSWDSVAMVPYGGLYSGVIEAAGHVTTLYYYVVAVDEYDQSSSAGSPDGPFSVAVTGDNDPPTISQVITSPTEPVYGQPVLMTAVVTDESGVANVTLYYRIGDGSWVGQPMEGTGGVYNATIPAQDWGVVVRYYVNATDTLGITGQAGSRADPLSYVVGDATPPVLQVMSPQGDAWSGNVSIEVFASDEGSGVESIEVMVDGSTVGTWAGGTVTVAIDTTALKNGGHTLVIVAADGAGNSVEWRREFTVANPAGLDAVAAAVQQLFRQYGLLLGAGTVVLGVVIWELVRRRRTAQGGEAS